MDVARASAVLDSPAKTVTESALPKLMECPTVPDEVHMPMDMNEVIKDTGFKIIEQHSIRMHKSLTRVISLLRKV